MVQPILRTYFSYIYIFSKVEIGSYVGAAKFWESTPFLIIQIYLFVSSNFMKDSTGKLSQLNCHLMRFASR